MKKLIFFVLLLAEILICVSCGKNEIAKGLEKNGTYYENINNFTDTSMEEKESNIEDSTEISKAYLQGITYEILEVDKKEMVATLEVSVPNLTQELPNVIEEVFDNNTDASYDELLQILQKELTTSLVSTDEEKTTTIINLPMIKENGEYKLVYNQQWEQAVYGQLKEMYLEYYRQIIGGITDESFK